MQDTPQLIPAAPLPDTQAVPAHIEPDTEQNLDVWFAYRIGSHHFVLDKTLLTEIVIQPVIYPIPKSPGWLCGVINLRGNVLPVFDLSESLSTVCRSTPGEFVLVIDKGNEALAIVVDGPPRSLINPVPQTSGNDTTNLEGEFFQPGVQADNAVLRKLDVRRLVKSLHTTAGHA